MVDIQTISIVFAAVSVVIGVANSILTNERAERRRQIELETRQAEFYSQQYTWTYEELKHWNDVLYVQEWKTWDEFLEKYSPRLNPEAAAKIMHVFEKYQRLGVFVREKLIDRKFIYKDNPIEFINTWERLKPIVMGMRELYGDPKYYDAFEWLANKMKEMYDNERKGEPTISISEKRDELIKRFEILREERRKDQQESEQS